jgi:hypothetical protein
MKKNTITILFLIFILTYHSLSDDMFNCNELLGRPTENSITVHACANKALEVFYDYGKDSSNFSNQTESKNYDANTPFVVILSNLEVDNQYFYRMRYREIGTNDYLKRPVYKFHTQRASGSSFSFAIEADPHLDTNSNYESFALSMKNILSHNPDFVFDMGDNFMSEKLPIFNQTEVTKRILLLRSYYDYACRSVPLFLVIGNHEGELGWKIDNTANNMAVLTTNTRKLYYPNPEPDGFYSGDTKSENFVGLRQSFYSWTWGDALFVVLDPYWNTVKKPGWGWTLGLEQYTWFKNTLASSKAKFKFVFCHQLVGGNADQARGGTEFAHLFEWGGMNADSTWGFDANRPGWEKPIHQLMVENGVNIFFHGHDHFFGKQEKDGVIYQECPQPSNKNINSFQATAYGYKDGVLLPGRGYLMVNITDTTAKVDFVGTLLPKEENGQRHNKDIIYSYTITKSGSNSVNENLAKGDLQLSVSPNISQSIINIKAIVPQSQGANIEIYDLQGRLIRSFNNIQIINNQVDLNWDGNDNFGNTVKQGVYLCRLSTKNQNQTVKFTIMK